MQGANTSAHFDPPTFSTKEKSFLTLKPELSSAIQIFLLVTGGTIRLKVIKLELPLTLLKVSTLKDDPVSIIIYFFLHHNCYYEMWCSPSGGVLLEGKV